MDANFAKTYNQNLNQKIHDMDTADLERAETTQKKISYHNQIFARKLDQTSMAKQLADRRKEQDEANSALVIDTMTDRLTAYVKDIYDEISTRPTISMEDAINSIQDIKKLFDANDENNAVVFDAIYLALAVTQEAFNRAIVNLRHKTGLLFEEFTADGYKLMLRRRPKAAYKADYATADDPNAYLKAWSHQDINSTLEDEYHYYVSAYAVGDTGKEYTLYLGTYGKLFEDVIAGKTILARTYAGGLKNFSHVDSASKKWRMAHIKYFMD